MDINIKRATGNTQQEAQNRFQDSRPKIREVSVRVGLPKMLSYWSAVSRWTLILLATLLPVFFLPFTDLPVAVHKELLVFIFIFISFFALLGRILVEGRIRYPGHLLMISLLFLVLVWGAATFFSFNHLTSLIGSWATPDSFFAMLLFAILTVSIVMTFDRRDIIISLLAFLASLSFLGIFELLQLFKIFILPFAFTKNSGFNPIGSVNEVGVLLAFGLVIVSGLMSTPDISKMLKKFLGLSVIIFILSIIAIDFWAIWIGLALAMIFLISFLSVGIAKSDRSPTSSANATDVGLQNASDFEASEYQGLQLEYFRKAWLPSVILLISLIFLFIPSPFARFVQAPVEVSPNFNATLNIAFENLKSGHYFFGSGPNTFGYIFNLYKPSGINQTIFWSITFNSGASAMASWVGTVGVLGVLALLFLMAAFIWTGRPGAEVELAFGAGMFGAGMRQAIFVAVSFLFIMWFIYAVNFTIMALAFWGMGLFLAASMFKEIRIFTSPPKTFLFSLLIVGLMVGITFGVYFELNRYVAEIYFSRGNYASAIRFWQYDERYFQGLSQSIFLQLNDLLAKKDIPQETLRTEFQNITADTISAAREAQNLNPQNPANSILLGNIYENLIPFIADATTPSLSAYSGAVSLDPENPSNYLALARVKIAKEDLDGAIADLEKSLELKNDYAPARFLLVQIYDRQGKLTDAIKRAEELVSLNINDVGALFQLGFLYYKNNQFEQAGQVFERTVTLSPNYSNARYFLGLIYDKDATTKSKALEQFNKIAELNPDNEEIKKIVVNLIAKKPALFGITPPAPAPQNRTEAPVQEGTKAPVQPLKK